MFLNILQSQSLPNNKDPSGPKCQRCWGWDTLLFNIPQPCPSPTPTKKNDWNNTAFWSIIISFGLIISQVICFPILTSNRCNSNSCLAKLHITSWFHDSASSRLLKNFNIMHAKICHNVLCVCSLLSLFFFLIHPDLTQTKSAHSWCLLHCEDLLPYQPVAQLELNVLESGLIF